MGAERRVLCEETVLAQRAVHFVGADLMESLAGFPYRISCFVLARNPCSSCSVEQVLRAEYVGLEEQLRILYAAVNMAFSSKVYDIVDVIF